MSNLVFPDLVGVKVDLEREPIYRTQIKEAFSGKEQRRSAWSAPRYRYRMNFEFLRSAATLMELQKLVGFFARHAGAWDSFLFTDPEDCAVSAHPFGVGNATTVAFQLQRSLVPSADLPSAATRAYWPAFGDGYEPVWDLNATYNLLSYSEELNNAAWLKNTGVTINANADTDPLGGSTADQIVYSGAGAAGDWRIWHDIDTPTAGTKRAGSIYLRSTSPLTLRLCIFDPVGYVTCNITSSWQRFELPVTASGTSGNALAIYSPPGVNSSFTVSAWGGQMEPGSVATDYMPTPSPAIYVGGVRKTVTTDYTIGSTGIVTFGSAPTTAAVLTWTGHYYRRVRFDSDSMTGKRLVQTIWEANSVDLRSVIP